jgi:dihydroorotase (multifunctional complex type)
MKVIRHGEVFQGDGLSPQDIVISGETIQALIPRGDPVADAEVIDATGLVAIPGAIDVHVHTREPGYTHKEDIESATRSAAAGGYTTIFGMPNVDPPTTDRHRLAEVLDLYRSKSLVDYNHNPSATILTELQPMAAMGIAAYKIYMVVDTGRSYPHPASIGMHDHGDLYKTMQAVAATGLPLMVHPHDQRIMDVVEQGFWAKGDRSPRAYALTLAIDDGLIWDIATALLLRLAEATGCRLHIVHVQTTRQVEMIAAARERGIRVTGEVNHWALFLGSMSDIEQQGSYVLSYLVEDHHKQALWDAMESGVVDMLASDHAPHTREEKEIGWTDAWAAHTGTPGIQFQLPLMLDAFSHGRISLRRLVDLTSRGPAETFGLARKGAIAPGKDADITLVDLTRDWTITNDQVLSKPGWTPYDGRHIQGSVARTISRGTDVLVDGTVVGTPGNGKHANPEGRSRQL